MKGLEVRRSRVVWAVACGAWAAVLLGNEVHAESLVTAKKATAAPKLDGVADDAVWKSATGAEVSAVDGANFGGTGKTTGSVKAAYMGDMLYLLIQWKDATLSLQRSPWAKQADGSWTQLKDAEDKGGDNNKYYEDKAALIWSIDDSIFGFERRGCQMSCHSGQPGKPFGNKYSEEESELGDIWHIKNVRTSPVGMVDDQYLDNTRYDPKKSPSAGRHTDPGGGGYSDIVLKDGVPELMHKDATAANRGGTYWLAKQDAVPFDDSKFKPGDEVAAIAIAPLEGDRGDIRAGARWNEGTWTVEIARKLETGSDKDVQFSDLTKAYPFGVAFFDNAQVRHAVVEDPLKLVFEK